MSRPFSTTFWRPTETSLTRESFNDIVNRRKTDVPATLVRMGQMSRLAMLAQPVLAPGPAAALRGRSHSDESSGSLTSSSLSGSGRRHRLSFQLRGARPEGSGSIRLGTPVVEERRAKVVSPLSTLQRSVSMPEVRPTPAARFGYMAPGAGRIQRSPPLGQALADKVRALYDEMDADRNGALTRAEVASHFKRFADISAAALFNEVNEDKDDVITFGEFMHFWEQVKENGYSEEDLMFELDEIMKGRAWVDFLDTRGVGTC
mmetsp:Transcript_52783/g.112983  ORF Transcript_52783/g.112983 Transcript_52783/m.112983 type:complete len:261 (+) Transcript_52783:100-882(+)